MTADAPRPQDALPPPGWYPDHESRLRWWDGHRWTVLAPESPEPPEPPEPQPEPTWSIGAHLGFLFLAVITPLVIRLTAGKRDPYTKHHSSEALNAQIWFAVLWTALLLPFAIPLWSAYWSDTAPVAPAPEVFVAVGLGALVLVAGLTGLSIYAAVQASRGHWCRYPLPFRVVPGSRPKSRD